MPRVERDARDRSTPTRKRDALVQLDELGEREERMAGIPVDLGCACEVAEYERVRCRSVHEAECHARKGRVEQRALALDDVPVIGLVLRADPFGSARDEIRDDGIEGEAAA